MGLFSNQRLTHPPKNRVTTGAAIVATAVQSIRDDVETASADTVSITRCWKSLLFQSSYIGMSEQHQQYWLLLFGCIRRIAYAGHAS